MIQTPSNPESGRRYLTECIHTRIIIYPLNMKIDFEKTLKIFFCEKLNLLIVIFEYIRLSCILNFFTISQITITYYFNTTY